MDVAEYEKIETNFNASHLPVKRFDDCGDVGRFIRYGNEESGRVVSPGKCQIDDFIPLECWYQIVDQQIASL
jgi:hypothetical protein